MSNPHGTPIWYELMSPDTQGSKTFYDDVIGWTVAKAPAMPCMDYRLIATAGGEYAGGVLALTDEMIESGAKPGWFFYVGVDDVDATVDKIAAEGGAVIRPPWTIEDIGRMALVADPQSNLFYVMRGASEESSTAFDRTGMGKCNWNELATSDQQAAHDFYTAVFGWTYPDTMPMGELGDYVFVAAAGQTIGATMTAAPDRRTGWRFYFRAPDIEVAADRVARNGGSVHQGPMEVPGGDRVIIASDAHGVPFGVVGPGRQGE